MRSVFVRGLLLVAILAVHSAPAVRAQDHVERLEFLNATIKVQGQSSVPGLGVRLHLTGGAFGKNASLVPAIDADGQPEARRVASQFGTTRFDQPFAIDSVRLYLSTTEGL